jgi:hypothetical protein
MNKKDGAPSASLSDISKIIRCLSPLNGENISP